MHSYGNAYSIGQDWLGLQAQNILSNKISIDMLTVAADSCWPQKENVDAARCPPGNNRWQ